MSENDRIAMWVGYWFIGISVAGVVMTLSWSIGVGLYHCIVKRLWVQFKNSYDMSLVYWEIQRLHKRGVIDYFVRDKDRTLPESDGKGTT